MKSKIAFTSCVRFEAFEEQPQWADIASENPDYLFLLGDQIYMDYGIKPFSKEWNGKPKSYTPEQFAEKMTKKYNAQWEEPHFKALFDPLRAQNRVFGIWDDHDFAWNNVVGQNVNPAIRKISFELFQSKFPTPADNPGEIYQAIDTPLARVIFLDVRSHAQRHDAPLPPNGDSALLGEKQFVFLKEKIFENHGKPFTIICSGITLRFGEECWTKYERDFNRLMWVIKESQKKVLFLAGDIHENKFVAPTEECPCHEIVASGLAINYLGLGIPFDDRHNWGLLKLSDDGLSSVVLVKNGKQTKHVIE